MLVAHVCNSAEPRPNLPGPVGSGLPSASSVPTTSVRTDQPSTTTSTSVPPLCTGSSCNNSNGSATPPTTITNPNKSGTIVSSIGTALAATGQSSTATSTSIQPLGTGSSGNNSN